MRQILCDHCQQVIDPNDIIGDDSIIFVAIATISKKDAMWREYHRRCARQLTIAEVWQRSGLVPL